MIVLSPPLALVSALVLPFLLASTRFFQVRTRNAERGNRIAGGRLNGELQESLNGIEVIRAFGRQAAFVQRFRRTLHGTLVAQNGATLYSALYVPVTVILAALVTALLLWAGTRPSLADWGISVGTLTAYILLFQRFFKPIVDAGDQWQIVQAALSGAERIFQVLALPPEAAPHAARADPQVAVMVDVRDPPSPYLPHHPLLPRFPLATPPCGKKTSRKLHGWSACTRSSSHSRMGMPLSLAAQAAARERSSRLASSNCFLWRERLSGTQA